MPPKIKIAFHTLGCKLNYAESAELSHRAQQEGFTASMRGADDEAEAYVINTCSVTENADKECLRLVKKIKRKNPDSIVVVTGCYAQLQAEKIMNIEGVDMALGVSEKFRLAHHIRAYIAHKKPPLWGCAIDEVSDFHSALSYDSRTRAFLKVQDGCDYSCSFCTIPQARGKSRSDTIEGALSRIDRLVGEGVKEIILTGINLGTFLAEKGENFYDLLSAIERRDTSDTRFRISSIEPNLISEEIIRLAAGSKKIAPHFHIPLQSGSNRILGLMRRRYRKELYEEKVYAIKKHIPDCAIGVDAICGFPSETESDFEETYRLLSDLPISYLHVFTYSERAHTQAPNIRPIVPMRVRRAYNASLRKLSVQKMKSFEETQKGKVRPVIFEKEERERIMRGYTDNYIRVETTYQPHLTGKIVEWELV